MAPEKDDKIMNALSAIMEKLSVVENRQNELEAKINERNAMSNSPSERNVAVTQALSEALRSPELDDKVKSDLDKTVDYVIKTGKSRPYLFA